MGDVQQISRAEYKRLGGVDRRSTLADEIFGRPVTDERAWFSYGPRLGIVLFDNVDHDWSWVVLARDPDRFAAVDVGTSLASFDDARRQLTDAMLCIGH